MARSPYQRRLQALEHRLRRQLSATSHQHDTEWAVLNASPDEADMQAGAVRCILGRLTALGYHGDQAFAAVVRADGAAQHAFAEWNASRARLGLPPLVLSVLGEQEHDQ